MMMRGVIVLVALFACGAAIDEEVLDGDILTGSPLDRGGTPISIQNWNSIVSLQRLSSSVYTHACSGTILTTRLIISAAQCFEQTGANLPNNWRVRSGTHNHASAEGLLNTLTHIIKHPDWNPTTFDNDIAILRVVTRITFSGIVGWVRLSPQGESLPDEFSIRTAGWSSTIGGSGSVSLLTSEVQVIDRRYCESAYAPLGRNITDNMICTGEELCTGDYGSPLISNGTLHGLASWGYHCLSDEIPGVYTKVSSYTYWIADYARILY